MDGNLVVDDIYIIKAQGHTKLSRSMEKNLLKYPKTTHEDHIATYIYYIYFIH